MSWLAVILALSFSPGAPAQPPTDISLAGAEAQAMIDAFSPNLGEGEISFAVNDELYLACDRGANRCLVRLSAEIVSLYRSDRAAQLYRALAVKEFGGRWGDKQKFLVAGPVEIFCTRFAAVGGTAHSCLISVRR